MITNKHITKIITGLTAIAVIFCLCLVLFCSQIVDVVGDTGITMEYEDKLFNTDEILSVNIIMDPDDWEEMLANAASEEYYECDVKINGKTFHHVGIRPKGNTSLTTIASDPTTDRYSLKLEFDHYVEGQTCYGLDKLILNNNYADATNMKEALIYDMYQYLGADASLYNYASLSVNGEYWGLYLALEGVEESFMLRNYGTQDGNLYKPDSMDIGGGGAEDGDFDFSSMGDMPDMNSANVPDTEESADGNAVTAPDMGGSAQTPGGAAAMPDTDGSAQTPGGAAAMPDTGGTAPSTDESASSSVGSSNFPGNASAFTGSVDFSDSSEFSAFSEFSGGFAAGGFSMGGSGANLNYTDDDLDSYSTIWDGEVTDSGKKDHKRVVAALKNISEGTDLEDSMDIDNLLRYMAVHVFSVNDDSLTGTMAHNYYLYEYDGKLNLIPWDYNLSLGGMGSSEASSVVNDAIDGAFSGTDFFDTLMENEDYHEQYYACLEKLVDEYINGGAFDAFYERVRSQIDSLVESDPTAFYTYEEYQEAADTLYQVVKLRGESIEKQMDGSIASYASKRSSSDQLVDTEGIDLSVMGMMNTGQGGGMNFGNFTMPDTGNFDFSGSSDSVPYQGSSSAQSESSASSSGTDASGLPSGGDASNLPEGVDPSNLPEGVDPSNLPSGVDASNLPSGVDSSSRPEGDDISSLSSEMDSSDLPEGVDSLNFSGQPLWAENASAADTQKLTLFYSAVTVLVLIFGFLFLLWFTHRRKFRYRK